MKEAFHVLRWCLSLGRKFTIVVPWATSSVVLGTLVSQLAILMATFLPLKIVILLGSDGVPRYFPSSFASIDRDLLVGMLSAAAAIAFLGHIVVERFIKLSSERGARRLLEKSHKLLLFENQDQIAADAYQRYARALASGVFVALVFVVLAAVYRGMALVLIAYTALVVVAFHAVSSFSENLRRALLEKFSIATSIAGNIGFLVGFAWLVVDFLFYSPPGLLPAVVSLLLSRLALTRLAGSVADVAALHKQQPKLDALFFHGKAFMPVTAAHEKSIWPLLTPESRVEWISGFLQSLDLCGFSSMTNGDLDWFQMRVPHCAAFLIRSESSENVLVKLFDEVRRGMARHEAELFTSGVSGLPAPDWLGVGHVDGRSCHVMSLTAAVEKAPITRFLKCKQDIVQDLLAVEPPSKLIQRYERSRFQLHQRIEPSWFEQVAVAANEDEVVRLRRLQAMTGDIQHHLRLLPSSIVNPDLVPDHLLLSAGRLLAVHWGSWKIEPLGCGWPVHGESLPEIDKALVNAAKVRRSLKAASPAAVRLAALMYSLEHSLWLPRLSQALELVPDIEQCLVDLGIAGNSVGFES